MEERYDRDTGRDSNYELRYVLNIQVFYSKRRRSK